MRRTLYLSLFAGVALAGGAAALAYATRHAEIAAVARAEPSSFDPAQAERGALLAGIGNCGVCHTASGGAPYAGGRALATPFGTIYTSNITPDPDTGIGTWSQAAFVRAMHEGVDRQGRHLYPAFPYDYFTKVSDQDLTDIYAFLMTREAVAAVPKPNELGFPFNIRLLLAGWQFLFLDDTRFTPDPAQDEVWNRGAYLVEGLGHCGACHSTRNALGAATKTGAGAFAGGMADGWYVPPLTAATPAPLPWTEDALLNYLIDGWDRDHGVAAGPMRPVADDLYEQSEDDVTAIAAYVLSLKGGAPPAEEQKARRAEVRAVAERLEWGSPDTPPVPDDPLLKTGAAVFERQCSECHKVGSKSAPLALATVVHAPEARSFMRLVLHGIQPPPAGAPDRTMPARALQVTDDELVALAAFVRDRFSDKAPWPNLATLQAAARAEPRP